LAKIRLTLVRTSVIAFFMAIIVSGPTISNTFSAAPTTFWVWRQPPFIIEYVDGYPYVIPSVAVVAWGGADGDVLFVGNYTGSDPAGIEHGIYRSNDFGTTWDYLGKVDENEGIGKLVVHPTDPTIVFAGFGRTYYQGGVYRSADGGDTWVSVLPYLIVIDIEVDNNNPNIIYATGNVSGGMPNYGVQTGIYKSLDYGVTWEHISNMYFSDLEVHPINSNTIIAARTFSTNSIEGIYRSVDAGINWEQISTLQLNRVTINPENPSQMFIYGNAYKGIWRTDNDGETWRNVTSNLPQVISSQTIYTARFVPGSPNEIWVSLKYDGMYVSYNSGESWHHQSNGLPFLGMGIFGPQCGSSDISSDRFVIECSGRVYIQGFYYEVFLPITLK